MSEEVIIEIQDPMTFRVIYDKEADFLYANIPVKATPSILRKIIALTGDTWRYLEDRGLVLILSAWASESGVDVQAVGKAIEEEYKGLLDEIKKIVEEAGGDKVEEKEEGKKKTKRSKKARKKAKKKTKRNGKRKSTKKKGKKKKS